MHGCMMHVSMLCFFFTSERAYGQGMIHVWCMYQWCACQWCACQWCTYPWLCCMCVWCGWNFVTDKAILGVGCMMHAQYIYDPGPWSWCMHVGMMHVSLMRLKFCHGRTNKPIDKAILGLGYMILVLHPSACMYQTEAMWPMHRWPRSKMYKSMLQQFMMQFMPVSMMHILSVNVPMIHISWIHISIMYVRMMHMYRWYIDHIYLRLRSHWSDCRTIWHRTI